MQAPRIFIHSMLLAQMGPVEYSFDAIQHQGDIRFLFPYNTLRPQLDRTAATPCMLDPAPAHPSDELECIPSPAGAGDGSAVSG